MMADRERLALAEAALRGIAGGSLTWYQGIKLAEATLETIKQSTETDPMQSELATKIYDRYVGGREL